MAEKAMTDAPFWFLFGSIWAVGFECATTDFERACCAALVVISMVGSVVGGKR